MFSLRSALALILAVVVFTIAACGPKKTGSKRTRIGRDGRANVTSSTSGTPYSPTNGSSYWYSIGNSAGDSAFQTELYYLTYPTLAQASAEDQLGYVSSNANDTNTGVRFWAFVPFSGNGIDGANSELNIEIYDQKYQTARSDGSLHKQVRIYIGKQNPECFGSVQGYIQNNVAQVNFTDCVGSIVFSGNIQGNNFVGSVYYSTPATGGLRTLGQFQAEKCRFFRCN